MKGDERMKKPKLVGSLDEYQANIEGLKLELIQWAMGIKGSWKANLLFLALPVTLLLISIAFGWTLMIRILGMLTFIAFAKIVVGRIKDWRKARRWPLKKKK